MSLESQLTSPVTIVRPATTAGFDYGTGATLINTVGLIQQVVSRALAPGGWGVGIETEMSEWTLFLLPGTDIEISDRVTSPDNGAVMFEVVGVPEVLRRRGRPHHIEVTLKTVSGGLDGSG